jgi:hypothetical protein
VVVGCRVVTVMVNPLAFAYVVVGRLWAHSSPPRGGRPVAVMGWDSPPLVVVGLESPVLVLQSLSWGVLLVVYPPSPPRFPLLRAFVSPSSLLVSPILRRRVSPSFPSSFPPASPRVSSSFVSSFHPPSPPRWRKPTTTNVVVRVSQLTHGPPLRGCPLVFFLPGSTIERVQAAHIPLERGGAAAAASSLVRELGRC